MKIFSWVHRRFNNRGENVNKNGDVSAEEEQFPAENKCNDDAYERWGGGILAIGTFGYDPLMKDEIEHDYNVNDYFSEEEDGGDSSQLEEQNPLVVETEELEETEMEGKNWSDDEEQLQFGYEYMMMKKKERTTLADLFTADRDQKQGKVPKKEASDYKSKTADYYSVKGKSKNKLEARPIQKLSKLMRRMLKRKIHPDVGPVATKVAAVNNNNNNNNNNCQVKDDSASLLPTTGPNNI